MNETIEFLVQRKDDAGGWTTVDGPWEEFDYAEQRMYEFIGTEQPEWRIVQVTRTVTWTVKATGTWVGSAIDEIVENVMRMHE